MKQLLIMFAGLVLATTAQAASFDCAKAGTKVEKLICADAGLSKLDEELNAAYKTALQDEKQADSIKQMQKQWMKERNGCADAVCVKRAYETRLLSLAVTHTSPDDSVAVKKKATSPITSEKPTFTNESDKLKFMQGIIRQHVFKSPDFPPNSKFCEQFLTDFTSGKKVVAVEPDVITDDENDPRLKKWHGCKDAEQQAENVPVYRYLNNLGGPPYRYYQIELDGNPKNGKEDVIYTEVIKGEFDFGGKVHPTLSGATGYAWVDLKSCVVKGGAGIGGANAIMPLLPKAYRLSMIVKYRNRNLEVDLYPLGTTYRFGTNAFVADLNHRGHSCAWYEPEGSTHK